MTSATLFKPESYETLIEVEGKPLGRGVRHDPESLRFLIPPRAALATSLLWDHKIRILRQWVGSCTGHASVANLGCEPFFSTVNTLATLDDDLAMHFYAIATGIDPYLGTFPPTDTGSDGLSVAKAVRLDGLILGYKHATSIDGLITALQFGPVITGNEWQEAMDNPQSDGLIRVGGELRGGHEWCWRGVDLERKRFRGIQSWGEDWADHGYFDMTFDDVDYLLHRQGDITQFVPLTSVPPTPKPVTPTQADLDLIAKMDPWERTIISRLTKSGSAALEYRKWRARFQ